MRPLVVQLTTDDQERVAAALTVAMTAAASGAHVSLWLAGPATMFAVPGRQPAFDLEFAPDLDEALKIVSTPAYMCATRLSVLAVGIEALVARVIGMAHAR